MLGTLDVNFAIQKRQNTNALPKKTIIKLAIIEVHIQVVTRVGFKMLGQAAIEQRSRKQQRNQRRKFFFDAADLVVLDVDHDQLIRVIL